MPLEVFRVISVVKVTKPIINKVIVMSRWVDAVSDREIFYVANTYFS